ncbi:MAG: hypothetical protein QXM58_03470 [Candidatus Micrarchaeaceae archaeon]
MARSFSQMRNTIQYEQLRYDGITPVIPRSGNKYLKTIEPKEMGCGASLLLEYVM